MKEENIRAKVLVVDDDVNLLDLLVDTLTTIGYRTTPAHGGVVALEKLKDDRFDLMITDIKMPDLDGIQLLKKVRRHYPDMPVLFITGYGTPEMIGQSSPDGILAKPFRIAQIEALIEETLSRKGKLAGPSMRKVLVVDSDAAFRTSLADALSVSNYVTFGAGDELEALKELQNGHFHAVIASSDPSERGSVDLGRKVKQISPKTSVILIGPKGSPEPSATDLAQCDQYVRKPFQIGEIVEVLNRLDVASTHHHN
jgi:DNA-binding NtrC family response regulator